MPPKSKAHGNATRALGKESRGRGGSDTPVDTLFAGSFASQRAIYEAVAAYLRKFDGVILSPRKGYVALYRLRQLGAVKPSKEGLLVGLALQKYPKSAKLKDVKNLGGGDRNKKALVLPSLKDFDANAKELIKAAWIEN
jgi:predicted transport protein